MYKSTLLLVSGMAAALVLSGCEKADLDTAQQSGAQPPLPEAKNYLVPPIHVPTRVGWQNDETPQVAEGLKITKIADGFEHSRQVLPLPNGDILVVEGNSPGTASITSPKQLIANKVKARSGKGGTGGNRVTLLRPQNDGSYRKYPYIEHLNSPFGIQLVGDDLYIANTDGLLRYHYRPDETKMSSEAEAFTDLPSTINHHWTKSLLASQDGRKLYVGVGSNSNVGENGLEVEYRRAAVLEVDIASRSSRIFASGVRNPTALDWEPNTGKLWVVANERDEIGSDLVPDYLTSLQDGGFYGWPYSYYGQHVDTRVQPQRPDLVEKAITPDYALGSHVAALGVHFSRGDGLPEQYRHGVFVSEHGSWNRSPLSGYRVTFISFSEGKPTGPPQPVVTGFISDDESELHGAPVGLAQLQDGSLLVADDVGNTIWKVSAAN
ncbi:PQQ-dependent sugar dehydrogenase [Carnimonas nigrificans]|uniref:PQQ-dependent sugar dehydrogenase n=1 Tax=Carnimonas nigrificans TaxID=64323 RepID=UPI00046E8D2F|nr:sorbosone dehydrogenase family protein [Carnimonas nigrificans]